MSESQKKLNISKLHIINDVYDLGRNTLCDAY